MLKYNGQRQGYRPPGGRSERSELRLADESAFFVGHTTPKVARCIVFELRFRESSRLQLTSAGWLLLSFSLLSLSLSPLRRRQFGRPATQFRWKTLCFCWARDSVFEIVGPLRAFGA